MKKILSLSIFSLNSPTNFSRLLQLYRFLNPEEFRITFLVRKDEHSSSLPKNIDIIYHDWALSKLDIVRKAIKLCGEYDLLIASKTFTVTGLLAHILSKCRHKPFILDTDDLETVGYSRKYPQEVWAELFLRRAAKNVSVASQRLLKYWKQGEYIPNSVNVEDFNPQRFDRQFVQEKIRAQYNLKKTHLTFIWVVNYGRAIDDDDFILRIWRELKKKIPFYLLLVGDGVMVNALKGKVGEYGLEGNVRFTDRVEQTHIQELYLSADMGILPLRDTLYNHCKAPIRLYEMMAMQLPLVVTDVGEPASVVEESQCGLFVRNYNPQESIEKIIRFVGKGKPFWEACGRRGRIFLHQKRNFSDLSRKFENLIYRALQNN